MQRSKCKVSKAVIDGVMAGDYSLTSLLRLQAPAVIE
jgi:hypothetical protein